MFLEEMLLDSRMIQYMYNKGLDFDGSWEGFYKDQEVASTEVNNAEDYDPLTAITSVVTSALGETVGSKEQKLLLSLFAGYELQYLTEAYRFEKSNEVFMQIAQKEPKSLVNSKCPDISSISIKNLVVINGDLACIRVENVFDGIWRLGGCAIFIKLIEIIKVN